MMFKSIVIKLGRTWGHNSKAVIYLRTTLLGQEFPTEIEHLREPVGRSEPMRARALDLFLDSVGLIRSGSRTDRSSHIRSKKILF